MGIRIGVLCPSEIALRRFLPSLMKVEGITFVGVAVSTLEEWTSSDEMIEETKAILISEREKAKKMVDAYGGCVFEGYNSLINSTEVDAIYIPLPPSLHYKWALATLEAGKNALVEKPFTTSLKDTRHLIKIAKMKNIVIHENYMFIFHSQLTAINRIIDSEEIGKIRLYRISFGFPKRAANDFRYKKELGGGALLDCGGYTIKYASLLLGPSAKIISASSFYEENCEVDIFGTATLVNNKGIVAQISFGMDNDYKCELEAWGSTGSLKTRRVLTAPDNFQPDVVINHGCDETVRKLPSDESFVKSIKHFLVCVKNSSVRKENYCSIEKQSFYIESFIKSR